MSKREHEESPVELRPLAARLDALGEAERRSAPASLEDRLLLSTRAALRSPGEAPAPIPVPVWRTPLRLAAAVAVVAGAGLLATVALRGGGVGGPVAGNPPTGAVDIDGVQSDLDAFLASLETADESIVTLRSDMATTEKELDAFWASEPLDLNLTEDSL